MIVASIAAVADTTTTSVETAAGKGTGSFSITMTDAEDGHTFKAYRIFDGSVDTSGKLSDIAWAAGVNTDGIADALATAGLPTTIGTGSDAKTLDLSKAEHVAAALAEQSFDTVTMQKVADVFYARRGSETGTVSTKTGNDYVITGQKAGYYLVTDEYTTAPAAYSGAATLSRNILAVVGNVTAKVKNDKPEVDKKVLRDNGQWEETNEAGIGETVAYEIDTKVPNYTGYTNYFFVVNDTLSNGLTFDGANTIKVTVGGTELTAGTDYVVYTGNDADGHTFQIAFKHIKNYTIGAAIVVTYSATVNENAVIGGSGNPNDVDLIYSNNPNDSGDGNPEDNPKPDQDHPTGTTPKSRTITYVAELDLTKYKDSIADANKLAGAQFTLTGTSTWVKGVGNDVYEEAADGSYYKLKDGTFTTSKPHGEIKDSAGNVKFESNEADYDSTTKTYKLTKKTTYETETQNVFIQKTTGTDGKIVFKGLGAGTYTLTETITPDGYNTADPITVTFTVELPEKVETGNEEATWSSNNAKVTMKNGQGTTGIYETSVIDLSGSTLPSTGGMGTTILYIGGSILVLAAAILLITKRRMNAED